MQKGAWIKQRPEGDWEIALVDINPVILEATEKMVRRFMSVADRPAKITASVERKDVLDGATIVICTIGVGGRRAWEQDVWVPRKFGIYAPVGDTVGPGGGSRSMRMIPPMVAIATDCDRMCPNARFINYGNPMTAVVRALWRKTNVRPVGLCMGTEDSLIDLAHLAGVPRRASPADGRASTTSPGSWKSDPRVGTCGPSSARGSPSGGPAGVDRTSWASPFGGGEAPGDAHVPVQLGALRRVRGLPRPQDGHVTEFFLERFPGGEVLRQHPRGGRVLLRADDRGRGPDLRRHDHDVEAHRPHRQGEAARDRR